MEDIIVQNNYHEEPSIDTSSDFSQITLPERTRNSSERTEFSISNEVTYNSSHSSTLKEHIETKQLDGTLYISWNSCRKYLKKSKTSRPSQYKCIEIDGKKFIPWKNFLRFALSQDSDDNLIEQLEHIFFEKKKNFTPTKRSGKELGEVLSGLNCSHGLQYSSIFYKRRKLADIAQSCEDLVVREKTSSSFVDFIQHLLLEDGKLCLNVFSFLAENASDKRLTLIKKLLNGSYSEKVPKNVSIFFKGIQ